jgi:hypothetical protein
MRVGEMEGRARGDPHKKTFYFVFRGVERKVENK